MLTPDGSYAAFSQYPHIGNLLATTFHEDVDNGGEDNLWQEFLWVMDKIYNDIQVLMNMHNETENLLRDHPDEESMRTIVAKFSDRWYFDEEFGSYINFVVKMRDEIARRIKEFPF